MDDKKIQAGQFEENLAKLAAFAKNKGNRINYGDIFEFFPEDSAENGSVENVLQALSALGVKIVQDDDLGLGGKGDTASQELADPVWAYYKSISKFKLLTYEEEVEAMKVIAAGKEAQKEADVLEVRARGLSGAEKEQAEGRLFQLKETAAKGQEARTSFLNSNLRLVVSIAKRYQNNGLPLMDLIQEGNIGLMKGLDYFDYTKGFHFSTYATWWIRQSILRAIGNTGRTIRLPIHMNEQCSQYRKAYAALAQENGRKPEVGEIAEYMGVTAEKVESIRGAMADTVSLDAPIKEEEPGDSLADFIPDMDSLTPEDAAINSALRSQIFELLDDLDARERDVLIKRFGLNGDAPMTLEEIGAEYRLTRERIRQIEGKALRRLRSPVRKRKLQGYI